MGIIETAKDAFRLAQQLDNIELQRRILELQQQALDLTESTRQANERIAELEEELSTAGELQYKDNMYWRGEGDGPYCSRCWDKDRKLVHLHYINRVHRCPDCNRIAQPRASSSVRLTRG